LFWIKQLFHSQSDCEPTVYGFGQPYAFVTVYTDHSAHSKSKVDYKQLHMMDIPFTFSEGESQCRLAFTWQSDVFILQSDVFTWQSNVLTWQSNVLTWQSNAFTWQSDALQAITSNGQDLKR
jgi:hypothetical protein